MLSTLIHEKSLRVLSRGKIVFFHLVERSTLHFLLLVVRLGTQFLSQEHMYYMTRVTVAINALL
jgi:hypothetical protein